jgi:hypothetical protein
VFLYEFPVTPDALFKTGVYVRNKVDEYLHYATLPDDAIPPCSVKERWERPAKFAVKKEGRKIAVKLFDDLEAAEQRVAELGTGHFVECRAGESIKCQSYCLCRQFCDFYQQNILAMPVSQPAESVAA